jgi:hypothetical protein
MTSVWRTGGVTELPGTPWSKFDTVRNQWRVNLQGDANTEWIPVPFGAFLVIDWRVHRIGPLRWKPFDSSLMVPYGQPVPPLPSEDYVDGMSIQILFHDYGLTKLTANSDYIHNAMYRIRMAYSFAAEAQAGQLAIHQLIQGDPIWNAKFNQNFVTAQPGAITDCPRSVSRMA